MPVETRIRQAFAAEVTKALGGLTFNQASYKTGLSDEYIRKMAKGKVPSEAVLERFSTGLSWDLERLRVAAGYSEPSDVHEACESYLRALRPDLPPELLRQIADFAAHAIEVFDRKHQ